MKTAFWIVALCVFTVGLYGQKLVVPFGFYKGEQFLDVNETEKTTYTEGLIDGFLGSGLFGAPNEAVDSLKSCITGMDNKQLTAILTKYIKDHPERWQEPTGLLAFNAFSLACPSGLKNTR
jgi:hypothetical protein